MSGNVQKAKNPNNISGTKGNFQVLNPNAAGIDIGSEVHYVAVPEGRDIECVKRFYCFTYDLYKLADWLKACKVETVVMESTGIYWIPVFQILEARGFEVKLVNARHVKNVPGRKTDVQDCQWLQKLHSFGLLSGSFRPEDSICVLRSYIRQRDNLIRSASAHIQRMQKALGQMNIQLHKVISDITGLTGMKIIKAILKGERDTLSLAQLKHPLVKRSDDEIARALEGDYRKEHLFSLKQELELYEYYREKINECDKEIEKHLATITSKKKEEDIPVLKKAHRSTYEYEPGFDLKKHLYRIAGVDLTKIKGIEASLAQTIVSEVGLDMSKWETEKQFTSWLGLCPNNKKSGERIISSRTLKVVNRAAGAFRLAARSAGSSKSALGAFYRRIRGRSGGPAAVTATAHKIAKILYRMLKYGEEYVEVDMQYYERQYQERIFKNMQRKAKALGYMLLPQVEVKNEKVHSN